MARSVSTFLMFDGNAKDAVNLYVSTVPGSELRTLELWGAGQEGREGSVKRAELILAGHEVMALDTPVAHKFTFTPSVSLFIECESEEELDKIYATLSEGGEPHMAVDNYGFSRKFGWFSDRFGVSWQLNWA